MKKVSRCKIAHSENAFVTFNKFTNIFRMQHVQEGLLINLHSNSTNDENETLHCKGKYLSYSNERNDNNHFLIKHLFNYSQTEFCYSKYRKIFRNDNK